MESLGGQERHRKIRVARTGKSVSERPDEHGRTRVIRVIQKSLSSTEGRGHGSTRAAPWARAAQEDGSRKQERE